MDKCSNEDELLRDEMESTNSKIKQRLRTGNSVVVMITTVNQTMAAMAGNIYSMGNAPKRLHADTASPPNAKRPKTANDCHDEPRYEASGDESADAANCSALLQVTRALQEPAAPTGSSNVGSPSKSFLDNISQDYDAAQKTTEAVTAKLAEFVNNRFSAKHGDGKFQEKSEKYGRLSNCHKVTESILNPEIWDKLTHQAKWRDLRVAAIQKGITKVGAILTGSASKIIATLADSKNSNITSTLEEHLTFSTDAIALLFHSNQSLLQDRRDLIRPCLNKACVHVTFQSLRNSSTNSTVSRLQTKLATLQPVVLAATFTTNLAITSELESLL